MNRRPPSVQIFISDLVLLNLWFFVTYIHFNGLRPLPIEAIPLVLVTIVTWYVIALNSNVARVDPRAPLFPQAKILFVGYSVLTAVIVFCTGVFSDFHLHNKTILWALFFAAISSGLVRLSYVLIARHVLGWPLGKSVLIIGGDRVAEKVLNKILRNPSLGYTVCGMLADYYHPTLPKELYLGPLNKFSEVVRSNQIDEVIIALPLRRETQIISMVGKAESEGLRVRLVPDFFRFIRNSAVIEQLDDIPLIGIREAPLDFLKNRLLKRTFDICFSIAVLLLTFPLLLIIAAAIKLTSPGPILFRQERVGANNVKFMMHKFRTMVVQDRHESETLWTTANDSRVTPLGAILRRTNLDELPQFWNVLNGKMSVVGPRPEREQFVEEFGKRIANYRIRHMVKSGITGLAQVNGFRGDTSIDARVECDIRYLESWSFWLDLKIILLTVFSSRSYRNAY